MPCAFSPGSGGNSSDEGCKLLDSFAIVVQLTLASTALLTLVFKRWRERPQRPVPIWALDVSKQFIGAFAIHFLNLAVSYIAGRPHRGPHTNLCVWYFLNVAIDTTVGVAILWGWLKLLQNSLQRLGVRDIRTGQYGPPPLRRRMNAWIRQTALFIVAEALMKLCVLAMLRLFPVLFVFGNWALRWTKGNYRYQVIFVMLIFPLIMNAAQFWVVDTIVKVTPKTSKQGHDQATDDTMATEQDTEQVTDEHTPLLQSMP